MALIASIDGPNRDIYLSIDTVDADIHPIDIYKEMRTLRRTDESLRKYDLFLAAFGNVSKGGGKFTERYVQCLQGTRIIPYDVSHELTVIGTIITDDGQEGTACFDRSLLTATTIIDINYVPPQVEVVRAEAELKAITQAAFGKEVTIDQANGFAGTGLNINNDTIGTRIAPVNNFADAYTIAHANGIFNFQMADDYIFSNESLGGEYHTVCGDTPLGVVLVIDDLTDVTNIEFQNCTVTGALDSNNVVRECVLFDATNVNRFVHGSTLFGSLVFSGNTSVEECFIAPEATNQIVEFDFNNLPIKIIVSDWSAGVILLKNMPTGATFGMSGTGGIVSVDASCTGGTLVYGGSIKADLTNAGGLDEITDATVASQVWDYMIEGTITAQQMIRLIASLQAAKVSGMDADAPVFRDLADTKDRLSAIVNNGNRTSISLLDLD